MKSFDEMEMLWEALMRESTICEREIMENGEDQKTDSSEKEENARRNGKWK